MVTLGTRPSELRAALDSIAGHPRIVVANGCDIDLDRPAERVTTSANVGVPAARHLGLLEADSELVGFLDDDAVASAGVERAIVEAFGADPRLGAVALRLVDETGLTNRRHVPRFGGRDADRGGTVALFLGGACAIRTDAYLEVGGYFTELFYGHEEVELSWRLIDKGWRIEYLADASVFHPRTDIGRHPEGWWMTGRNRVWIARRTLPATVAAFHVLAWLCLGVIRAPGRANRSAYIRGWCSGWATAIDRRPIRWRTVWRLTRLGRPPIL